MKRYMIDFRQNMERPDNAPTTPFKEPGPPLKPFPKLGAVAGVYDSSHTTISAGVAIFHLASSRVVLCRHSVQGFWFLPKGRRDAGEESRMGAEREGYEEVSSILSHVHHSSKLTPSI